MSRRLKEVVCRHSWTCFTSSCCLNPVCSDHFSLKPTGMRNNALQEWRKLILLWRCPREEKSLRILITSLGFNVEQSIRELLDTLSSLKFVVELAEA